MKFFIDWLKMYPLRYLVRALLLNNNVSQNVVTRTCLDIFLFLQPVLVLALEKRAICGCWAKSAVCCELFFFFSFSLLSFQNQPGEEMSLLRHKKEDEHETILNLLGPFHFSQHSLCINTSAFWYKWQHPGNDLAWVFFFFFSLRVLKLRTTDQEHISHACSFLLPEVCFPVLAGRLFADAAALDLSLSVWAPGDQ